MLETDAPYFGFKGCRNTEQTGQKDKFPNVPASLPLVAAAVAECYSISVAELARHTTYNARRFFSISR